MIKKILLWFFLVLVLALMAFGGWLYLNRERIEQALATELRSYLDVGAEIGYTEIDPFSNFPYISLEAHDVFSYGSGESRKIPLVDLELISFGIEFWDILNGDLVIRHVVFSGGEINIIDPKNLEPNYLVLKKAEDTGETMDYDSIKGIEVEDITFRNVKISYSIPDKAIRIGAEAKKLIADLVFENKMLQAGVNFNGQIQQVTINKTNYVPNQPANFKGLINLDLKEKRFYFDELGLQLKKVPITASLNVDWTGIPELDLMANIGPSAVEDIQEHLPNPVDEIVKSIKARGKAGGSFIIKGKVDKSNDPRVEIKVPLKNLEIGFFDSFPNQPFVKEGLLVFTSDKFFSDSSNRLEISAGPIEVSNSEFSGKLLIPVLVNDHCLIDLKGDLAFENVILLSKSNLVQNPDGNIKFDMKYLGPLLKENQHVMDGSKISGEAEFEDLRWDFAKRDLSAEKLNGRVEFNNEVLSFTEISTRLKASDVSFTGYAINFLNFLFYEDQDLHVETLINSNYLNLEDLLRSSQDTSDFLLEFNPRVSVLVKPEIQKFKFKQFRAEDIRGRIKVKGQKVKVSDVSMKMAQGKANMELEIDATDSLKYSWIADFDFDSLLLDSTFFYFKNFGQDFLKSENLGGRLSANGGLYMESNDELEFDPASFQSNVKAEVVNGKLKDFEPIKSMAKYLDKRSDLDNIEFDELNNDIVIKDKRVLIPQMDVRSSAKNALISGFHNFDNSFEYHLQVPVFSRKKRDKDEQYGIVEEASGLSFVLLKIEGTPDDYKVDYDSEELMKKMKRGFFMETQEAFDLFRKKKKEKTVEFEDEEYYDIDQ